MSNVVPIRANEIFSESERDLVDQIQTRIFAESQGTLDDFSPASPISAITEGQAYASVLLGENINRLPEEFVLKYLEILGLQQSTARNSIAPIQFTRTTGFTQDVRIPKGFRMFTQSGLVFTLDESVILSEAVAQAVGFATSVGVGTVNNVENNTINGFSLSIPGLDSVTNISPARGGTDLEDVNVAISRGLSYMAFRHLTSPRDYEVATRGFVGEDYAVKAYSYFEVQDFLFSNDAIAVLGDGTPDPNDDLSRRNVYLVLSDDKGETITETQQNRVKNYLSPRLQSGTEVVFLIPEPIDLSIEVTTGDNPPETLINRFVTTLRINQSVLYTGIGRSLNNRVLRDISNSFLVTDSLTSNILDSLGTPILTYSDPNQVILSSQPNTVIVLKQVTVTTSAGLIYTYDL